MRGRCPEPPHYPASLSPRPSKVLLQPRWAPRDPRCQGIFLRGDSRWVSPTTRFMTQAGTFFEVFVKYS